MNGSESGKWTGRLRLRCEVTPVGGIEYAFASVLAAASASLCGNLFARSAATRLDVIISELAGNALEHAEDGSGTVSLQISIDPQWLDVRVGSKVSADTCRSVRAHVRTINRSTDPKALLAQTMRERRAQGRIHGLGLIRLASETRARLSVSYDKGRGEMRVRARVPLGGE